MNCFAAVMTGKGTGAISTVSLYGQGCEQVIKQVFKPGTPKPILFDTGEILLGSICDNDREVDQVTIGCEGPNVFAIHCHGNPLIVEMIVHVLRRQGVQIVSDAQLCERILSAQGQIDAIAVEAGVVHAQAKTLEGTKIVMNQPNFGLGNVLREWLGDLDTISLDSIQKRADEILRDSSIAKLIIFGCKTVLAGPPNTGKSTLLNCLAGRQKSIVTDIGGTTRDWVTARRQIESLSLELIDTAGLDENLSAAGNSVDNLAQKKTLELIGQADLILLVLDSSRDAELDYSVFERRSNKKMIAVLNKSDLPARFDPRKLPDFLSSMVQISAKEETGIDNLVSSIRQTCGVIDFDARTPICFTDRQRNLLNELKQNQSKQQAEAVITELLKNTA